MPVVEAEIQEQKRSQNFECTADARERKQAEGFDLREIERDGGCGPHKGSRRRERRERNRDVDQKPRKQALFRPPQRSRSLKQEQRRIGEAKNSNGEGAAQNPSRAGAVIGRKPSSLR